ncbi:MAG: hypothetical protein ACP5K1_07820, partial [Candidatus Bathyarchaeia archaeon]
GDVLVQVAHTSLHVATSTQAAFTADGTFAGSMSGTLSGSVSGSFNTIWVDAASTLMRGLTTGRAEYSDAFGTIELLVALDVEANLIGEGTAAVSLKGYAFNRDSTGDYAGKQLIMKLEGSLTGGDTYQLNGEGWVFSGFEDYYLEVSASREYSPGVGRSLELKKDDRIVQYAGPDITLDADADACFVTRQEVVGTVSNALAGSIKLAANTVTISEGTYGGGGYSAVRFSFTSSDGTLDGFLLLDNSGYVIQEGFMVSTGGTGIYSDIHLMGPFYGWFYNPPNYYSYEGAGIVKACKVPPQVNAGKPSTPVGGSLLSANKLIITAPYLILIGSMAITALTIMRRRL